MSDADPKGKKRQTHLARKFYDADIKNAGITPVRERLKTLTRLMGEDHDLVNKQRKILKKMEENISSAGDLAEFRALAHEIGQLQRKCEHECRFH